MGCSSENNKEGEGKQPEKSNVSLSFREVEVVEENLQVHVKGEVRSSEDIFYYKVEQGKETIAGEDSITLDSNREEWSAFEFNFALKDENAKNEEVPFITFYAKDDGKIVNPNYVPIEIKDS